jgi:RNA polymerase sigma-70 factor (ECF subfamily)
MVGFTKNEPPPGEQRLVRKAVRGDGEAFGVLYERYLDAIYRCLYFRVVDKDHVEDLTEEVFVKAWESLPRYKPGQYPFKSWLYRIAHNLYVDTVRKRNPLLISDEDMDREQESILLPEDKVAQQQEMATLAEAVQELDEIAQQVVILRFVEGLSHRQVGCIIGKSEQASRVIQHRALNTLHTLLRREETGNG